MSKAPLFGTLKDRPSASVASLGGATHIPAQVMTDNMALLAAADRSLYTAKNDRRDRLVMSGQVVAWPEARSA
jgi:hypothetical protein